MTVGERIKELRKSKNLTQAELGAKLGVSASMIGQYENGFRRPKRENLLKIIDALSIDLGRFFAGLVSLEEISEEMDMPVDKVKAVFDSPELLPNAQRQEILEKVVTVAFLLAYELNPSFGAEIQKSEKKLSPARAELLSVIDSMNEKELLFFLDLAKSIKQHNSDTTAK